MSGFAERGKVLLGTASLAADLTTSSDNNWFGVGTGTRGNFRNQFKGLVDEVRISDVARDPDGFLFAVPEPGSAVAVVEGALLLMMRRRMCGGGEG